MNTLGRARVLLLIPLTLMLVGCPPKLSEYDRLVRDGNDYFETEDYRRAEEAFTKALELRPGEPGTLVNRGNARMMLGDLDGAMRDYDAAIEADPNLAHAYANRGILRDKNGDVEGAIADYRKALELNPKLGERPSIWRQILYNPPTETIKDRLDFLEALRKKPGARGAGER